MIGFAQLLSRIWRVFLLVMALTIIIGFFYFNLIPEDLLGNDGAGHFLVLMGYRLFGSEVGSIAGVVSIMTCLGLEVVIKTGTTA